MCGSVSFGLLFVQFYSRPLTVAYVSHGRQRGTGLMIPYTESPVICLGFRFYYALVGRIVRFALICYVNVWHIYEAEDLFLCGCCVLSYTSHSRQRITSLYFYVYLYVLRSHSMQKPKIPTSRFCVCCVHLIGSLKYLTFTFEK